MQLKILKDTLVLFVPGLKHFTVRIKTTGNALKCIKILIIKAINDLTKMTDGETGADSKNYSITV